MTYPADERVDYRGRTVTDKQHDVASATMLEQAYKQASKAVEHLENVRTASDALQLAQACALTSIAASLHQIAAGLDVNAYVDGSVRVDN